MEVLTLDDDLVVEACLGLDTGDVVTREARDDAVDEGVAEGAALSDPLLELLGQTGGGRVPQHVLPQGRPVVLDELARDDREPLGGVTTEVLEPVVQQGRDLEREGGWRTGGDVVVLDPDDPRLGRVRHQHPQVRAQVEVPVALELGVRGDDLLDALDPGDLADRLPVLDALERDVEEPVLCSQQLEGGVGPVCHVDDCDTGIHDASLVGDVDHPVDEAAQEVPAAHLEHGDRSGRAVDRGAVERLHGCVLWVVGAWCAGAGCGCSPGCLGLRTSAAGAHVTVPSCHGTNSS